MPSPRRAPVQTGDDVRSLVRRELLRFAVPAVAGVVALALASLLLSVTLARRQSMGDAEQNAVLMARSVVQPHLTEGLVEGRTADIVALDRAFDNAVADSPVADTRIWSPDGTIIYSDDPRLVGEQLDPTGIPSASSSALPLDTVRTENRYLEATAAYVEVVLPLRGPGGRTYLFQLIQREDAVPDIARQIWWTFVPILLGTLVLVGLLLLALAIRMARRLSAALRVRQDLLQHAVDASDLERRRIASDLHDGTVQRLAGVGFRLSGMARRSARRAQDDDAAALTAAAEQVQDSVRELRSLLVDIYPPNVERTGVQLALEDVASGAGNRPQVEVAVDDLTGVDPHLAAVVYRIGREALMNACRHADASHVSVHVRRHGDGGTGVALNVTDDGRGFDPGAVPEGHLGLRIMQDLAESVGGRLTITSAAGAGTTMTFTADPGLELP